MSIADDQMRHGRKSKSKRFNDYKQHIVTDLDTGLILACSVAPANRPEDEATPQLAADVDRYGRKMGELSIDRAYVNSPLVADVLDGGGEVLAKPWGGRNSRPGLYGKRDFKIDTRKKLITCPAGQVEPFEPGETVEFDPETCGACPLRSKCTQSASGRGRTVHIGDDEQLQQRFRRLQSTRPGRERLRERTAVEHRLAHVAARQGPKARYRGVRKNLFDLRRVALQNLETIQRTGSGAKGAAGRESSRSAL